MEDIPILRVDTPVDENDGSAERGTGLSLRDAILIANSTPGDEIIELESEQTYQLSIEGEDPRFAVMVVSPSNITLRGDLDIASTGGTLTIRGLGEGATIDGDRINRVFEVHDDITSTGERDDLDDNGARLVLENVTITGGRAIEENSDSNDAEGGGAIFIHNRATASLSNCHITGNSTTNAQDGGGIANEGGLVVRDCNIEANLAGSGGGISSSYAVTEISDSTITNNTASRILNDDNLGSGGGIQHRGSGSTEIINSNITNNSVGFRGGGVVAEDGVSGSRGSVTIIDSLISGNTANDGGGTASAGVESFTIENTTIENNVANRIGGGISGGIFVSTDNTILRNSIVRNNIANGDGGGIHAGRDLRIIDSVVSGNTAGGNGGGVDTPSVSQVLAFSSTFDNNTAEGTGGGLRNVQRLTDSTVSNNRAGGSGGGLFTDNPGIILGTIISSNESDRDGGGLFVRGDEDNLIIEQANTESLELATNAVAIANSTISGNSAINNGGGIFISPSVIEDTPDVNNIAPGYDYISDIRVVEGQVYASNVTITNNLADSDNDGDGNGGGAYIFPSEVSGNSDPSQGDRERVLSGNLTLNNSIVAGNFDTPDNQGQGTINPDILGAAIGNANNLVGNTEGLIIDESEVISAAESLGEGSDLTNIDSRLGELQDNGGLTFTHAPLFDSPAIDSGNNENILRETFIDVNKNGELTTLEFDDNPDTTNAQIPYDQRGGEFSRISNETVDIGAFELQEVVPEPNPEPSPEPNPEPEPNEDMLDTDIFRFQNDDVPGTYIYVTQSEARNIRENFGNFTEEGKAFQVAVESGDDLMPMYRFQSQVNPGTYLFVGETERENIQENFAESFTEEGLAFYTYDADSGLGTDFYRFQNTAQPGTYLFATGNERENIRENFPDFEEEGIAFSVDI